jgi:hypothetical protein
MMSLSPSLLFNFPEYIYRGKGMLLNIPSVSLKKLSYESFFE